MLGEYHSALCWPDKALAAATTFLDIHLCYHHKHADARHKMLQLRPILVLIMVLLKASTELWSFPFLGSSSGFAVWRLQWAAVCQLHFPGCWQG